MLGQLSFARLESLWRKENVSIGEKLKLHWLRYSLILIIGITLIALILPTGYAIGLMDLISYIFTVLTFIITLLFFIVSLPLAWLFSLIFGRGTEATPAPIAFPQLPPAEPQSPRTAHPLLQILQSFIFWLIGVALFAYIIRSYLKDNHHFLESLQQFKLVRILMRIWVAIQRWWYQTIRHLRQRTKPSQSTIKYGTTRDTRNFPRSVAPISAAQGCYP